VPQPALSTAAANSPAVIGADGATRQAGMPTPVFAQAAPARSAGPDVIPISYDAPAAAAKTMPPGQSTNSPQTGEPQNQNLAPNFTRGLSPLPQGTENLVSLEQGTAANRSEAGQLVQPANNRPTVGNGTPPSDAQFKHVHERLKQLGATYYLLEAWGDHSDAFRFYCRMSIGGNSHVTRPFYCVDADPLKAMNNVLQQVEDWQKGGGATPIGLTTVPAQGSP